VTDPRDRDPDGDRRGPPPDRSRDDDGDDGDGLDGLYRPLRDPTVLVLVVIALAAGGAMALGLAPTDDGGSGADGPSIPFRDPGGDVDRVQLRVAPNRSPAVVDAPLALTVLAETEDRPVANATVRAEGREYLTPANGTVVVRPRRAGELRVVAGRAGEPERNREYGRARTELSVVRRTRPLSMTVSPAGPVETGQAVTVAVETDGRPTSATVLARTTDAGGDQPDPGDDGEDGDDPVRRETGPDGRATFTFERAGQYRLRAERATNRTTRYPPANASLGVRRRAVGLSVSLATPTAGENATVTVRRTDTGERVDADLLVGQRRYRATGGRAVVPFPTAGEYRLQASRASTPAVRFESATRTVRVPRRAVALALSTPDGPVPVGGRATLAVSRADTGEPVDARIRVGERTLRTGGDGRATVRVDRSVGVTATREPTPTERFRPANATLSVTGPAPVLVGVEAPESMPANATATVAVTVANRGDRAGVVAVGYRVGDRSPTLRRVPLPAGQRETVELSVATPPPGEYATTTTVADERLTGRVVVVDAGDVRRPALGERRPQSSR
jgi:hypothetical protein